MFGESKISFLSSTLEFLVIAFLICCSHTLEWVHFHSFVIQLIDIPVMFPSHSILFNLTPSSDISLSAFVYRHALFRFASRNVTFCLLLQKHSVSANTTFHSLVVFVPYLYVLRDDVDFESLWESSINYGHHKRTTNHPTFRYCVFPKPLHCDYYNCSSQINYHRPQYIKISGIQVTLSNRAELPYQVDEGQKGRRSSSWAI